MVWASSLTNAQQAFKDGNSNRNRKNRSDHWLSMDVPEACKSLVRRSLERFSQPYITITPTFSICPQHGSDSYIRTKPVERRAS